MIFRLLCKDRKKGEVFYNSLDFWILLVLIIIKFNKAIVYLIVYKENRKDKILIKLNSKNKIKLWLVCFNNEYLFYIF